MPFSLPLEVNRLADDGWEVRRRGPFGRSSYVETTRRGAGLDLRIDPTRRLSVIARTGPGQGTLRITVDGRLMRRVRLSDHPARRFQLLTLPAFDRPRSGALRISVASSGRPVRIYGIAATGR